jgi:hypothetical protein
MTGISNSLNSVYSEGRTFYDRYFFDESQLDERIANLSFNLTVHALTKDFEETGKKKATDLAGTVLVYSVGKVKGSIIQGTITAAANTFLAPLGLDPSSVSDAVKYVVMPNVPKPSLDSNIQDAQVIYGTATTVLDNTGASNLLISINQYGAKAFATLAAEKLRDEGHLDSLKAKLKTQAVEVFHTSYLSTDSNKVGFWQSWKNVASNVWKAVCGFFCAVHRSAEEPKLIYLFQETLTKAGVDISLSKVSKDLDMEVTTQVYRSGTVEALRAARAVKNGVSTAASTVSNTVNRVSSWLGSFFVGSNIEQK